MIYFGLFRSIHNSSLLFIPQAEMALPNRGQLRDKDPISSNFFFKYAMVRLAAASLLYFWVSSCLLSSIFSKVGHPIDSDGHIQLLRYETELLFWVMSNGRRQSVSLILRIWKCVKSRFLQCHWRSWDFVSERMIFETCKLGCSLIGYQLLHIARVIV